MIGAIAGTRKPACCDFAFVTLNKADFSLEGGDHRQPHADFADLFGDNRSRCWVSLVDLLNDTDENLLANDDMELYGVLEVRRLTEILEAENLLFRQAWYNRHQSLRISIELGRTCVATNEQWQAAKPKQRQNIITVGAWKGAREAAQRTEEEIGSTVSAHGTNSNGECATENYRLFGGCWVTNGTCSIRQLVSSAALI